jgi:preprotein translocase subunit SecG
MTTLFYFILFCFLLVGTILSLVVLVQESKKSGFAALMGGSDSSDSLFGVGTADVLKKFTAYMIVIFMTFCIVFSIWCSSMNKNTVPLNTPAPIENEVEE